MKYSQTNTFPKLANSKLHYTYYYALVFNKPHYKDYNAFLFSNDNLQLRVAARRNLPSFLCHSAISPPRDN